MIRGMASPSRVTRKTGTFRAVFRRAGLPTLAILAISFFGYYAVLGPNGILAYREYTRELERRQPEAVTTAWWKELRGERIFLDYNQAARDRTIAGAYSPRPLPSATVSTPLSWDELDPDLELGPLPGDFTIRTVPERLRTILRQPVTAAEG